MIGELAWVPEVDGVARLALQVASALVELHERGEAHGAVGLVQLAPGGAAVWPAAEQAPAGPDHDWAALGRLLADWLDVAEGEAGDLRELASELQDRPPRDPARIAGVLAALARAGSRPFRYADEDRIGFGGMAEVRRVRDRRLGRTVALKVPRPHVARVPLAVGRFVAEGELTARLQHPGVVAVHDTGFLEDGRPFFTMREVGGQTLAHAVAEAHRVPVSPASIRPLVRVFRQVCQTVAYAHARGVVHRDLKPSNVMLGELGEVLVLDWGLALATPGEGAAEEDGRRTVSGELLGTPAYMAPEQARGEPDRSEVRVDVYGLGAMLYEIVAGRPPFDGPSAGAVIDAVLAGPPPPARVGEEWAEIAAICGTAMARDPGARFAHALELAEAVGGWLDEAQRRERALAIAALADDVLQAQVPLLSRAASLRERAVELLAAVPPWAPEDEKAPAWALEDEAAALELRVAKARVDRETVLRSALTHDPHLPEAHAALAEDLLEVHARLEGAGDREAATVAESLLRSHTETLPRADPIRARCTGWLRGVGALTLVTEPAGLQVELHRYTSKNRRLVPAFERALGPTPLQRVPLDRGSFLCRVRGPGRVEVSYPVCMGRQEHWDGRPPGSDTAEPIRIPRIDEVEADDCVVPAGWFRHGAPTGGPLPRAWCHAVVMRRSPVTNREYLAFLNDLWQTGRVEEAEAHLPRESADIAGAVGAPLYDQAPDGVYRLRPGGAWLPDHPVMMVNWASAAAFARWLSERTGLGWRLPAELEWEKAARGVDGRIYPWGDYFDASWCFTSVSQGPGNIPRVVDSCPVDTSPYGVRGLAGNVADWVGDLFVSDGPLVRDRRVVLPAGPDVVDPLSPDLQRPIRGGHGRGQPLGARAFHRTAEVPAGRYAMLGFRIARTLV